MLTLNSGLSARPVSHSKKIGLQWLRVCAACMVVFFHSAIYLKLIKHSSWGMENVPLWFGGGVYLFFAVSGYLMTILMRTTRWDAFIINRILRIYPTFFLAIALFYVAGAISGVLPQFDRRALLLMPFGPQVIYPLWVEWTLVFEIAFYVLVGIIILANWRHWAPRILVCWLLTILLLGLLLPERPVGSLYAPYRLLFSVHCVSFVTGMLLPLIISNRWVPHPLIAVLVSVFAYRLIGPYGEIATRWTVGLSAGLIVFCIASRPILSGRPWPLLDSLGDRLGGYTYALYLVHVPVIRTVYDRLPSSNPMILFGAAVAFSIVVALPLGELDISLYRWLKQKTDAWSSRLRAPWAGSFILLFFASTVYGTFL